MDIKDLLKVARRRWKTIIATFALAIIASAALSLIATPIYQSTAKVFISTDTSSSSDAYLASAFASSRVSSYADLATSGEVTQRVRDRLGLNLTPGELAAKVKATVPTNTVLIVLQATDPSARVAQQIAEAEATELAIYIGEVETPATKNTTPVKATITDHAAFSGNPISPRSTLNLAVAAVLGLLLGFVIAFLRDLFDTTIKSTEDIEAITEHPVMAHIAFEPTVPKTPLIADLSSGSPRSEAFRLLRTGLQYLDLDSNPKSFVITSAVPGEGKTSTSTNLAISLAQTGKRVLLVDGDLRRPRVARLLGLEASVGLTTVLVGRSDLANSIQHHAQSGIDFLSSGPLPPNPTEILQSRATRELMALLREQYDVVIIDAPPLLPVADAAIMASSADGAIVVVRHGRATRDQLKQSLARLEQVGARAFGLVINMAPRRRSRSADYGYGYGYGYGYAPELVPSPSPTPNRATRATRKKDSGRTT